MNAIVYNASLAGGTALASFGAGVQYGLGFGLMVGGVLVLGLTMCTALLLARGAA
jgi:hypothetical protein